jgi:hypothetical protein
VDRLRALLPAPEPQDARNSPAAVSETQRLLLYSCGCLSEIRTHVLAGGMWRSGHLASAAAHASREPALLVAGRSCDAWERSFASTSLTYSFYVVQGSALSSPVSQTTRQGVRRTVMEP